MFENNGLKMEVGSWKLLLGFILIFPKKLNEKIKKTNKIAGELDAAVQ